MNSSFDASYSGGDTRDSFAEALSRLSQPEALFDVEESPALLWSDIITRELEDLQGSSQDHTIDHLKLERNAWDLVHALYSSRYTPLEAPREAEDPYVPALTLVQQSLASNRALSDLAAIRDWLHNIPSSLHPAEIRRGYYSYTKNTLKQIKRTGGSIPRTLVGQLDPDAHNREAGKTGANWESEDASYESALVRSLFEYVRAGELGTALDMCRQSDQSWRASSLMGGNLWRDSVLDPSLDELDQTGMEVDSARRKPTSGGGMNRKLWKMTCQKIAASPSVKPYERALYGALSGDLNSVIPVCETWEDQLWAHINHQFESRIDYCLEGSSSGSFYRSKSASSPTKPKDSRKELSAAFEALYQSPSSTIQQEARHPLRIAQNHIILNKIPDLLTLFVQRVHQSEQAETDQDTLAHLYRFFAHFVLFLQSLPPDPEGNTPSIPSEAADTILQLYISVLESKGKSDLVALYAAHLSEPTSQIDTYSQFLARQFLDSDRNTRKAALLRAREHGLDIASVAGLTVQYVVGDIINGQQMEMDTTLLLNSLAKISPEDMQLIRSAEWLTFDHNTWPAALIHTNGLTRYFLLAGHTASAKRLISSLPPNVSAQVAKLVHENINRELQPHSREHEDFKTFFSCLDLNDAWTELWSRRPSAEHAKLKEPTFVDGLKTIVDRFYASVEQLLTSQWLLNDQEIVSGEEAEQRRAELDRLRSIYIPELVFSLHRCLMDSKDYLPSAVEKALELANIVANAGDEKPIWYEFLVDQNRLGEYLQRVKEASIAALEYSTNPFVVPQKAMR